MMKRLNTLVSAVLLGLCAASEAQAYSGKVYADTNGNGRHDKGEKVLGNVMVSDGLNVTKHCPTVLIPCPDMPGSAFCLFPCPADIRLPAIIIP